MRVAITAASGQLGAAVVAATVAEIGPEQVVALARTPSNAQHLGVEVRPGSYDNPAELEQSLVGIDHLLLVSGMAPPDQRVEQHRNVIAAARASGVRKLVFTGVQGPPSGTAFSPIVQCSLQTEDLVKETGLDWAIGRNGIYIEPDVEYAQTYLDRGEIANCGGDGRCAYTTRPELGFAYARLLTRSEHDGETVNLSGDAITQADLARFLTGALGTQIDYRCMSVEDFRVDRIAELGEFIGSVIAGIYEGIREGAYDTASDYEAVAGRPHQQWSDYFGRLSSRPPE